MAALAAHHRTDDNLTQQHSQLGPLPNHRTDATIGVPPATSPSIIGTTASEIRKHSNECSNQQTLIRDLQFSQHEDTAGQQCPQTAQS